MRLSILYIAVFVLLGGCANKQPAAPDWVAGESAQYKAERYLVGRGESPDQEKAKDRARADIAKIFQVAVEAESEDVQRYRSDESGSQYESQITQQLTTRTSQIVSGIQLVELWQDPSDKSYHALAVLPRQQAAAGLRQQISQLDADTDSHVERSRTHTDLFLKIAAADQAVKAQQERQSVQKMLQVVDITGRGTEPKWSIGKLEGDLDSLLKRVSITARVSPDSTPGLAEVLSGALAKAGFMAETGGEPVFVLTGRMKLDDLGMKDGWYWQRGVLEVNLTETANNRVRGTKRWNIKGNATDQAGAIKRALNQADMVLKQELRDVVIGIASSR